LYFLGVAAGIEFLNHELGKLRDIVVTTRRLALPEREVLLPAGPESGELFDQPRHYFCLRRFVVVVENPIRIVSHAISVQQILCENAFLL
jgi:hypothetical protein